MNYVSPAAAARLRAPSHADDFVVLKRNGHWCIRSGGSYFGEYASAERAVPLAIRVAREAALAGARTRVMVQTDAGERVVWSGENQVSSLAGMSSR